MDRTTSLTDADRTILRVLQQDSGLTNQALADRVGMSASACWRRVQAMEKAGLISGYAAQLDARKLGLGFTALAQVSLTRHDSEQVEGFVNAVLARPEVMQCFAVTGDADYVLRVIAEDLESYERFLHDFLFHQPGVTQVRTSVVVRAYKDSTALPL